MICAECGTEITGNYYKFLDNYLQAKYFDSDENNIFCSKECACKAVMLAEIDKETGEPFV